MRSEQRTIARLASEIAWLEAELARTRELVRIQADALTLQHTQENHMMGTIIWCARAKYVVREDFAHVAALLNNPDGDPLLKVTRFSPISETLFLARSHISCVLEACPRPSPAPTSPQTAAPAPNSSPAPTTPGQPTPAGPATATAPNTTASAAQS